MQSPIGTAREFRNYEYGAGTSKLLLRAGA